MANEKMNEAYNLLKENFVTNFHSTLWAICIKDATAGQLCCFACMVNDHGINLTLVMANINGYVPTNTYFADGIKHIEALKVLEPLNKIIFGLDKEVCSTIVISSMRGEATPYRRIPVVAAVKNIDFNPEQAVTKWNDIEVSPVREYEGNCEVCEEQDAEFWSVYLRQVEGHVKCIADLPSQELALSLEQLIRSAVVSHEQAPVSVKDNGVYKYLDCSTAHITEKDNEYLSLMKSNVLEIDNINIGFRRAPYGYWFHVTDEYFELKPKHKGFTVRMIALLNKAREEGCQWINMDADGFQHPDLKTYKW